MKPVISCVLAICMAFFALNADSDYSMLNHDLKIRRNYAIHTDYNIIVWESEPTSFTDPEQSYGKYPDKIIPIASVHSERAIQIAG
ncbi:MAG: hypothetical protein HC887_01925 [Desulfobacteraceae bacterium]|nr:hypothetical protein [Desulfobacteraceae bacterium]